MRAVGDDGDEEVSSSIVGSFASSAFLAEASHTREPHALGSHSGGDAGGAPPGGSSDAEDETEEGQDEAANGSVVRSFGNARASGDSGGDEDGDDGSVRRSSECSSGTREDFGALSPSISADHALLFGANGALSLLALTILQAVSPKP